MGLKIGFVPNQAMEIPDGLFRLHLFVVTNGNWHLGPQHLERVFQIFKRFAYPKTNMEEGTGLA